VPEICAEKQDEGLEREVVIMMTDMVQYARQTSTKKPEEIRDFLINYHGIIHSILHRDEFQPLEVEPSAGDGCLVVFAKRSTENTSEGCCTRAVQAAICMMEAISSGLLAPTRIGMLLGHLIEAQLGARMVKFGSCFAVANRLEELCGHFGTQLLMGREVGRIQQACQDYLVNVAKVSLTSVSHPMNIFTVIKPGTQGIPTDVDTQKLQEFIRLKNEAMEMFTGNLLSGVIPDFPKAREDLLLAQNLFRELTGYEDRSIERILEYIRETPTPPMDFDRRGMELMEKKRDSLGERLYHLSKELLKAMEPDFYHALVEDTAWERYFKLEWRKKGDVIIRIDAVADGIYYLDSGLVKALNAKGNLLATMEAGAIFGEMAYFGTGHKRTATVIAETDVVLRKISTDDFRRLPVIIKIFERIAIARRQEFAMTGNGGYV